jgi:hypothetical protein
MEETGEQCAADILEAIRLDRDLWLYDQYIVGPDRVEHALKVLIERRDACLDPDEMPFLASVIRALKKANDDATTAS